MECEEKTKKNCISQKEGRKLTETKYNFQRKERRREEGRKNEATC